MTSLEEVMDELVKSKAEIMEETRANVQFQSMPLESLEETMLLKATSHIQSKNEIEQHPRMKELSVGELMANT